LKREQYYDTVLLACMFHGLGSVVCSESESPSGTMDPLRYFGMIPWTGDRPITIEYMILKLSRWRSVENIKHVRGVFLG